MPSGYGRQAFKGGRNNLSWWQRYQSLSATGVVVKPRWIDAYRAHGFQASHTNFQWNDGKVK